MFDPYDPLFAPDAPILGVTNKTGDGKQQEARTPSCICSGYHDDEWVNPACPFHNPPASQASQPIHASGEPVVEQNFRELLSNAYQRGKTDGAQAMAEKAAQLRKLIALYREQYPMEENRSGWGLAFEIERSLAGAEPPLPTVVRAEFVPDKYVSLDTAALGQEPDAVEPPKDK